MDLLSRRQLLELAQVQYDTCVSLYMPSYHVESEVSQNPIRLKNLIKKTRQELLDNGFRGSPDEIVAPLLSLIDDNSFWLDQSEGVAAFLTPQSSNVFRLPLQFEELVVTGTRFHMKPLFPLLAANNQFYVLALSQNSVKLYQGTHYSISLVETTEIPESLIEALGYEERERSLQAHTANVAGGRHDRLFHGHGVASDDETHRAHDDLVRFFRDVDHGVRETLGDDSAPLVLAGVEYYLPLYKDVNRYKELVADSIVGGNPERLKPKELHAKAWEIVRPRFTEEQKKSVERFEKLSSNGRGLASIDISEIIPAAVYGRVDTLFLREDSHQWGIYDPESNSVELHESQRPGDEDLLDLAAVHTLSQGGTVHVLPAEAMPRGERLAATFRFHADVAAHKSA